MNIEKLVEIFSKVRNHQYTPTQLIILSGVYIALICNFPFLLNAIEAITKSPDYNPFFLMTLPILLSCLIIFVNAVFAVAWFLKPFLIINVMLSSTLLYATYTYGVVFDYSMIQNGFETDTAEAFSYINAYAILFVFITGVLPSTFIACVKMKKQTFGKRAASRTGLLVANVLIMFLVASAYFSSYAAVGRNNANLLGYVTPYKFVDAGVKYVNDRYFSTTLPYQILDNVPAITQIDDATHVTVLVIGETARAQNFSLNGYAHDTNQYTEKTSIISFSEVSSCGTATAVSLPCMFSRLNREQYDKSIARSQQNLVDIASKAGMDVLWVDNNNGSCKGVCARVNTINISTEASNILCDGEYCLDEALLAPLKLKLANLTSPHTLIVLHMMGSHGPTYFKRYSQDKKPFLPDCQRSDIQNCTEQEIVNTYDNTIAYTDFVLSEMIKILNDVESEKGIKSSMLYVSDHGESLGEQGVYLHGLPYAFAPQEQTHIPMLYWQTKNSIQTDVDCLSAQTSTTISHDNFFDIALGVMSIDSSAYEPANDIFMDCREPSQRLAANLSSELHNAIN